MPGGRSSADLLAAARTRRSGGSYRKNLKRARRQARRRTVRAVSRATTSGPKAARQARTQTIRRHTRQRKTYKRLGTQTIPRLEARRRKLTTKAQGLDLAALDPLDATTSLTRERQLGRVTRRLGKAQAEHQRLGRLIRTRRGRRAEPVTAVEAVTAVLGAIPPLRAGQLAVQGARLGLRTLAREGAETAVRSAPKAAPSALRQAAQRAGQTKAGQVAKTTGKVAAGTGKAAGRAATFPIRRPIKTAKYSFAAQAPAAVATGDLSEFEKVLSGEGVAAGVLRDIGEKVSSLAPGEIGENVVKDVFELGASAVPAIYMPVAGLVEAAKGDSSRLEELWNQYEESGLLTGIAKRDSGQILNALKEHPVFSALEARGAQAAVGRTAGAALRHAPTSRLRQAGSTQRKPLRVGGDLAPKQREYSRDFIEKGFQVAADRRRARKQGGQKATTREKERILRERVDRIVSQEEGVRRAHRTEEQVEAVQSTKGLSKTDKEGVSLAVQGVIGSPKSFALDLASFAKRLDRSHKKLQNKLAKATTRPEKARLKSRIAANREMRSRAERLVREGDPEAIFAAARPNARALRKQDEELVAKGLLDPEQARQSRLFPYARLYMGAKFRKMDGRSQPQLIDRNGQPLKAGAIEAHMRQRGIDPDDIAFVSQSPSARGGKSFYRTFFPDRQSLAGGKRSGKATVEGTFDPTFDALIEQRVRGRGIVDAVRGFDRTVNEFAGTRQRFTNYRDAQDAARNPKAHGLPDDVEWQPVRLAPLQATARETRRAEELFDTVGPGNPRGMEKIVDELIDAAVKTPDDISGSEPVILMPKQSVARLREHIQGATTGRRVAQVLSSGFKGVVLPTSPNWFLGNFVDVNLRAMLAGTTIYGRNAALGRKILKEAEGMDPQAGERARAGLVPGTMFGAAERNLVHRDARQFAGTALAPLARAFGTVRRTPGVKQVVNAYVRYRDAAFQFNDHFIERQAQYALLGKAARQEVRQTTGKWHSALKLGDEAIRDLAKGQLKTENQIRYAKKIEETLGQWTANSPDARRFLVDYAPFGMWARAATRFMVYTLPVKHPIKTGLGAMALNMTEEERDLLGLTTDWDVENRVPDNLQGSVPLPGGGLLPVQSIATPGFFADYQASLANMILPQFPLDTLRGLDWTGEKLTHEDGTPLSQGERLVAALVTTGESFIPFISQGQRVAENGFVQGLQPSSTKPMDPGLVDWLRDQSESRTITVPAESSAGPESTSSSGSEAGVATPWRSSSSTTSSGVATPWRTP